MPPKKAASGAKKTASSHASYQDMIVEAVVALKERSGSSRQAIKKYVQANNNLGGVSEAAFTTQFNRALQRGSDNGVFTRPKGTSGPVKLAAPTKAGDKPAAGKTTTTAKTTAAKPKAASAKKAPATKKAPAAKKTAKKTATKKAPAKKTASKSKTTANTAKARKTKAPTAAPAVEEKKPVVLGKTKSGRVTKSKAPQPVAKAIKPGKKAPAKKATTTKKATAKKA